MQGWDHEMIQGPETHLLVLEVWGQFPSEQGNHD